VSDVERVEILDEYSDEYRDADIWLPRCTPYGAFHDEQERASMTQFHDRTPCIRTSSAWRSGTNASGASW
jgi:hypothetical protein